MRYIVAVAPPRGSSGHRSAFERLESRYSPEVTCNKESSEGFFVRRPERASPTDLAAIDRSGSAHRKEGCIGTLLTSESDAYFDTYGAPVRLWLPHAVFPDGTPQHIILSRRSDRYRERDSGDDRCFERTPLDGVQVPGGLLDRTTRGALFRDSTKRSDLSKFPILRVRQHSREIQPGDDWSVLNPWTIELDTTVQVGPEDNALLQEAIETGFVDLHAAFRPNDWLRARLHVKLCGHWHNAKVGLSESAFPPIPRLLFGTGELSPDRARAFLILDELNGQFRIGGIGSPESMPAFSWTPEASRSTRGDWLVHNALKALGLREPNEGQMVPRGTSLHSRDEADEAGEDTCEKERLSDVLGNLFDDAVPEVLVRLGSVCEELITEREAKDIRSAARIAAGPGRADREPFVQRFCRTIVMPRSGVQVDFPAPPHWLASDERERWQKERFDAALRWSDTIPCWRLEEWWLSLIQPEPDAAVVQRWDVWNKWWKRHFSVSLFRWPTDFVPDWGKPPRYGVLGRATLGERFHLGGRVPYRVHGPWDDWPQTLPLEDWPCPTMRA